MGLYDREYYRDEPRGMMLGGDWSAVTTLIVINVLVFLADAFSQNHWIVRTFSLDTGALFHNPWNAWQLLTYGFVHDPRDVMHIAFNMLGLWVFGHEVELVYGRREFYKVYLSLIILAGLFNAVVDFAGDRETMLMGASGGVMGVAVLFACNFPRRMMIVFPIPIPMPAFVLVGLYVLLEILQTSNRSSHVAHWAHLGGAAFGFLYYRTGWSLFRIVPRGWSLRMPRWKPKLRVHDDDEDQDKPPDDYLTTGKIQQRVDQLLEKISREGEASLTSEERQFLADASRRYQQQRRR